MAPETVACPDSFLPVWKPKGKGKQKDTASTPPFSSSSEETEPGRKRFSEDSLEVRKMVVGINGIQHDKKILRCSKLNYSRQKVRERDRTVGLLMAAGQLTKNCSQFLLLPVGTLDSFPGGYLGNFS